jgi:hypothetical protein
MFNLLKEHMQALCLMLDQCHQALDFSEFEEVHILYTFWNTTGACSLQGWIFSHQDNIVSILDMVAPTTFQELCTTLGHT